MIGIYRITNPNGKVYIGQSRDINKRKIQHEYNASSGELNKLYNSIRKYGWSKHEFSVIELCKVEDLNVRERYWQEYYNVIEEGLNCKLTRTHKKPQKVSIQTRLKMSNSRTGVRRGKQSAEHIEKRVKAFRGKTYEEIYGKIKAEELKKRKSLQMTGKKRGPMSDSQKKAISKSRTGNFRTGIKHTEETIQKMKGPKKKVKCNHCGKVGGINVMHRYHFDNCKFKKYKS